MAHKQVTYKTRIILCISLLIILLGIMFYTNRLLNMNNLKIAETVNISGKQRFLSQQIAHSAIGLKNSKSQIEIDTYLSALKNAIKNIEENFDYLRIIYNSNTSIKTKSESFYTETLDNGKNRYEYIASYLQSARSIALYFENLENFTSTKPAYDPIILDEIDVIEFLSTTKILEIFDNATTMYVNYINYSIYKAKIIKNILIVLFFVSIIITIFGIFNPINRRLNMLLIEMDKQRNESEAEKNRFDLAAKGTSTGIWDWNIKGGTFYWNTTLKSILGLSDETTTIFTKDYFQSLLNDNDSIPFNNAITKHLEDNTPFFYDGRIKHQKGHRIWVRFLGQALWESNGKAYRMVGSIEDINDQKEAEIKNAVLMQGIEAANIAFAIIDLNDEKRNFTYASPHFCDITKTPLKKIIKSNMTIFIGPETSMSDLDKIDYALSEKQALTLKMLNYRQNGVSFWNQITLRPIFDDKNEFSNFYIVIFDDLTEKIARQEQEIIRQRNESLGSLAGSVAHEINNLLMPMAMAKDMLEDSLRDDCDPFAREQLNTIVQYAQQAKEIVQGILIFSRKESGNLKAGILYQELSEAIHFIESLLSTRTTLIFNEPKRANDKNLTVLLNSTELKQIITNLCRNAEQAFQERNGTITIDLKTQKLSNAERTRLDVISFDFAKISVTDNGIGIPEENLEKIFEPLFTTKSVGEGTGLGLSVIMGIVKSWGGAITVNSILGEGSTFDIYIPIHKDEDDYSDLIDLLDNYNDDGADAFKYKT